MVPTAGPGRGTRLVKAYARIACLLRAPIPERPRTPERTVIGVKRGQGTRIRDVPSLKTKGFGDNVDISPVPSFFA